MRKPTLFAFFCVFLTASAVASANYPYQAVIHAAATPVFSGPGTEYYVTTTLRQGNMVDIYYETTDWCAIKPPDGSFSWISALYVELEATGRGTVTADGLAARIGSDNTELCDTVQVKLRQGEQVLVLGQRETPENQASPLWYKIAPPSGEFRWIRRDALIAQRNRGIQQVAYQAETPVIPKTLPQLPTPTLVPRPTLAESPRQPTAAANEVLPIPPLKEILQDRALQDQGLQDKLASSRPDRLRTDTVTKVVDPVTEAFNKAFDELKEEAHMSMTRPTEDWVFQTLLDRGHELYEIAPTDADLEKVYHLVESLERTWAVRKEIAYRRQFRTGGLLTPPPSATPSSSASTSTSSPRYAANPLAAVQGQRGLHAPNAAPTARPVVRTVAPSGTIAHGFKLHGFDVVGRLGEFENPPAGYPPYAVADEKQQILCLISPTTGLALREHVGKVVGVNGILGFYEKTNQPKRRHITVQEVDVLQ